VECPLQSVYFKSEDIADIQLHRDST
jgi:hypothetical protein